MAAHSNSYTVGFITVIAVICSLILSTASSMLKERQMTNIAVDKKRNILKSFGALEEGATTSSIDAFYTEKVRGIVVDAAGKEVDMSPDNVDPEVEEKTKSEADRLYSVYILKEDGKNVAYTIPIIGRGLWSKLYGYIALGADLNEVLGITFYQHGETPGLGAEIAADWFQKNFVGKRILNEKGDLVAVAVVKGKAADYYNDAKLSHYVDGISGATITSRGVTKMLQKWLTLYEPYFAQVRGQ